MDNIGDILSSLSDKDIEALKETANSIFGSSETKKEEKNEVHNDNPFDFSSIDPGMISKIMSIMSALNSGTSDPRCDLIRALKPLLSEDKQKRADEAMQIMKMLRIIPMIKNF